MIIVMKGACAPKKAGEIDKGQKEAVREEARSSGKAGTVNCSLQQFFFF